MAQRRGVGSKDGPRSGIERQISGSIGPLYSSRISKRVIPPLAGLNWKVLTPLNRPSGIPPLQTIRRGGSSSLTVTGKARFGFASEVTLIRSPRAIRPSTETTPESQLGICAASVRISQTRSGVASISALDS